LLQKCTRILAPSDLLPTLTFLSCLSATSKPKCFLNHCVYAQPATINAQFGLPKRAAGNDGGAKSFEELNKMAAERMGDDNAVAGAGLGGLDMATLGDMMKDMDPNTIAEMMAEHMKDPQIQELVSYAYILILHIL
jgi:hypothetical protein